MAAFRLADQVWAVHGHVWPAPAEAAVTNVLALHNQGGQTGSFREILSQPRAGRRHLGRAVLTAGVTPRASDVIIRLMSW